MYVMFLLVLLQRDSATRFVWPLEKPRSRKHSDRGALSHHGTKIAFKHRFYYFLRLSANSLQFLFCSHCHTFSSAASLCALFVASTAA
jgi:hypothetical protein